MLPGQAELFTVFPAEFYVAGSTNPLMVFI